MSVLAESLKMQLSSLPVLDRAELARYLLTSLEPEEEGVAEAWGAEIARRTLEIRSGKAIGTSVEAFMQELRGKYP